MKIFPGGEECPRDLLDNPNVAKLNFWLPRFVSEVYKQDGKPYSPKSIHQLLAGLQCYMLDKNPMVPNFLNLKDSCFNDIHDACDSLYSELHQQESGTSMQHATVVTAVALLLLSLLLCCSLHKVLCTASAICTDIAPVSSVI